MSQSSPVVMSPADSYDEEEYEDEAAYVIAAASEAAERARRGRRRRGVASRGRVIVVVAGIRRVRVRYAGAGRRAPREARRSGSCSRHAPAAVRGERGRGALSGAARDERGERDHPSLARERAPPQLGLGRGGGV